MSDWAKKSDWPSVGTDDDWTHPITLNVYTVDTSGPNPALGSLIATTTQVATIPWRPEADPTCPNPSSWRFDPTTCFNGFAFNLTLTLDQAVHVPQRVIIGIAYNTQTWGYNPIGVDGPYTSLNVGLNTVSGASVGTDSEPDAVFWNTQTAGYYSDGGAGGVGTFRRDTGWTGFVPAFQLGVEDGCSTLCYVDADNGDDAHTGATPADAKKTIQAAIDQVSANGEIRVLPGAYDETASGRGTDTDTGPHQYGLFFPPSKPGIDLIGVTASDVAITDAGATEASITFNATNGFGPSSVFVAAANTTISGFDLGTNSGGENKLVEVIADGFELRYSTTSVGNGGSSIYINDFSNDGDVVKAYNLHDNELLDGTSFDIASGAGKTGPVSGRLITDNVFDLQDNGFNGITFNGSGTTIPWFVNDVGGAVITGNSFSNSTQYIRARGGYDNSQFDWAQIWNNNTFDHAAVAGSNPPSVLTAYTYSSGGDTFPNTRRISGTIQGAIDNAASGDIVLVKAGDYDENVTVATADINLHGAQFGAPVGGRTFDGASESTINGQISIQAADAELDGFSLTRSVTSNAAIAVLVKTAGSGATISNNIFKNITNSGTGGIASSQAVYLENGPDNVTISDNKISDISSERSAKGILVGDSLSADPSTGIEISGNTISNVSSTQKGAYGIQVSNGASTAPAATGYTELSITGNTISDLVGGNSPGWTHAIGLEGDTPIATITGNTISNLSTSGASTDRIAVFFESNPSFGNADVNLNSLDVGADRAAVLVHPALTGSTTDATCNWYGNASGPGGDGPGTGSLVSGALDYDPWLVTSALSDCPAALSLTPASKDYGTVASGSSSSATTFTVSNDGNASDGDITVSAVSLGGTDPSQFDIQTEDCTAAVLSPGETCTIDVAFLPTSTGGKSATLEVDSDDPANPTLTSALTGEGGAAADGTITIKLDTRPNSTDEFTFDGDGGIGQFVLKDDGTVANTSSFVTPEGDYAFTSSMAANWTLVGITCDAPVTKDVSLGTLSISLGSGENVTCTFTAVGSCTTEPFDDVAVDHPFCVHIKWMNDFGISTGFDDGTYRPAAAVSRQAMAAFMRRLAGATTTPCLDKPFEDVETTNQFCPDIQWMKAEGISTGFEDETFHPTEAVTRQAMAAFMARFAGATPAACSSEPFSDVGTDHPFCAEIQWMKDSGVSTGFGDGTYHPSDPVTRQAMAAFLLRVSLLLP